MEFAKSIKSLRLQMLLTQDEFAKALGVSFATVNRWETGKSKPTIKTMKLIDEFCKKNSLAFDVNEAVGN